MLPYVKQLVRILSERLGWNRARLKLMARLMRALPIQTTTNLAQLKSCPVGPGDEASSRDRLDIPAPSALFCRVCLRLQGTGTVSA
jgi:hypothetical protein